MKNKYVLVCFCLTALLISSATNTLGQQTLAVTGHVKDASTGESLVGVNIIVKHKVYGTVTDTKGNFRLEVNISQAPVKLLFSYIGYEKQEIEAGSGKTDFTISLVPARILTNEVVISASRVSENIMESPVSIEKLDRIAIEQTPSPSFYEAIATLKSVDMVTQGIGFKTINTRGFNSTSNLRFVQRIDGMDNQAPGLNFPPGNIVGITDLDLESAELIPGAASALYGPNAFSGILNLTSKSPFKYPGFSAMVRSGFNHADGTDTDLSPMFETNLRYAYVMNNKAAFKVNFGLLQVEDWYANDSTDVDAFTPADKRGALSPSRDGLNIYGDEVGTSLPIGPGGSPLRVTRTGYFEKDLVDYDTKSIKLDGALHYRVTDNLEASWTTRFGNGTTVYQGANRYSLSDFTFQQHKLEFNSSKITWRNYVTIENSGDSYDSRFLAINLNRVWKSDANWFNDYAVAYGTALQTGKTPDEAHIIARAAADKGRYLPGTTDFDKFKGDIAAKDDFKSGAKFNDQTKLYVSELVADLTDKVKKKVDLQVGGNYRVFDLNSNGTIFADTAGNDITIYEFGAFAQLGKKLFTDKLKLGASGRYDKSEHFEGNFTPRFSVVYTPVKDQHFRGSYQTGFRLPSTQEQFIFLDLGAITLIGGLKELGTGTLARENSYTLASVQAFGQAVQDSIKAGYDATQAVIVNRDILQKSNIGEVKPELIENFEIGYRGILTKNLYIDLGFFYNTYKQLVTQVRVVRPDNLIDGPDKNAAPFDIAQSKFRAFQMPSNNVDDVTAYGISAGFNYFLPRQYSVGLNYSYVKANDEDVPADAIKGFNTPEHKANVSFGNKKAYKNLGFNVNVRYVGDYLWEGTFGEGEIPAFTQVDAQISWRLPQYKSTLKLGGANLLNNRHTEVYGGPTIGGLYYIGLTFDELFN